jgi:saccharopine dehydrogenase-like NADP-dependent oxidoreductase
MESKIMMILGGYGSAGLCVSRLLLQETHLNFILAGRNSIQATNAARQLNTEFSGSRVQGMQVDATNAEELKEAFKSCDTVMVCVPITASKIGGGIVQAAFDARKTPLKRGDRGDDNQRRIGKY